MIENWNVTTLVGALRTIRRSISQAFRSQLQIRYIESGHVQYLYIRAQLFQPKGGGKIKTSVQFSAVFNEKNIECLKPRREHTVLCKKQKQ